MENLIPKISLKNLLSNDKNSLEVLSNALKNHGFFIITDHNISHELFKNSYEFSEKFFKLDSSIKNKYSFRENAGARGYTPFGKETALGETVPDLKEFWHVGREIDDTFNHRIMKNIKVNEVDKVNEIFDQLFIEMNNLGYIILKSISLTLDVAPDFFTKSNSQGNYLVS